MPQCDRCGEEVEKLLELEQDDAENLMLCPKCWGYEDARGDYEYERWKEEQDPNPDHERDIKEE